MNPAEENPRNVCRKSRAVEPGNLHSVERLWADFSDGGTAIGNPGVAREHWGA